MFRRLLCLVRDCDWVHVSDFFCPPHGKLGLYQCQRCKEVSVGSSKEY